MKYAKPVLVVSVIAALVLAVSACGGSDGSVSSAPGAAGSMGGMNGTAAATVPAVGPAAAGPHNAADVDFATGMIYHHAQAVQMSDLVLARKGNARVMALATRIKAAQTPEIATMSGWLKGWGAQVPDISRPMAAGMSMDGMMSEADMGKLRSSPMGKADTLFLTQMPEHHTGAIAMAKKELADGSNPEAKKLARAIISSQTAEIVEMRRMRTSIS